MIVLVHSGVCDARMWDGFEVPGLRHELRGFGQTPLPPSGSFSHAGDLIEALGDARLAIPAVAISRFGGADGFVGALPLLGAIAIILAWAAAGLAGGLYRTRTQEI